jgi:hypothetical protein
MYRRNFQHTSNKTSPQKPDAALLILHSGHYFILLFWGASIYADLRSFEKFGNKVKIINSSR